MAKPIEELQMKQLQLSINPFKPYCFLIFIILFMFGCNPEETPFIQEVTPEVAQLSTLRPTPTETPRIPTNTSTPVIVEQSTSSFSATSTVIPSLTPTVIPSATSTIISVPTLTNTEADAIFENFMATNGDCDLPCWWGFELGDSLENVNQTFINLGMPWLAEENSSRVDSDRMGAFNASYYDQNDGYVVARLSVNMQFHELDSSIEYIYIFVNNPRDVPMPPEFFRDWEQYYLSSFLQSYGKPTQVYFRVRSIGDPMDPPQYSVSLLYVDKGLAITYHVKGTSDEVCLDIDNVVALELSLFNPDGLDIWGYQFAPYNDEGYATLTWEAEIGESLDTFYETYKDSINLGCIQVP